MQIVFQRVVSFSLNTPLINLRSSFAYGIKASPRIFEKYGMLMSQHNLNQIDLLNVEYRKEKDEKNKDRNHNTKSPKKKANDAKHS